MPKNAQTWLLLGISLMVIFVITFFGPEPPPAEELPPSPAESRLLSEEEDVDERLAELERQMMESMRAVPRSRPPNLSAPAFEIPEPTPNVDDPELQDALTDKMQELEYTSLFASNIALTYRRDDDYRGSARTQRVSSGASGPPNVYDAYNGENGYGSSGAFYEPPSPAQLRRLIPPPGFAPSSAPSPSLSGASAPSTHSDDSESESDEVNGPALENDANDAARRSLPREFSQAATVSSKRYTLFEGTVLETALVNRLDSSFAGPIITMVTNDVYSHDRQNVIIPAGTKCLGQTKPVESLGQSRMAVFFHRLIMPDGYAVDLDQFQGLNQLGDTGLKDKVDNHYFRIFGVSIALGFLGAISQRELEYPFDSAGPQFARSAAQILDRFLNMLPTVTIREGHRVKVFLTQDLKLPAYDAHGIPSDI